MRHHITNIAVSILSELFSGSIVCWGNILLDVIQWLCFCASRTQGGPGGCSSFGSMAWRGCAIWQETYVELIISGCSGRTNGNMFLSWCRHAWECETRGCSVFHTASVCITNQFSVGMARERRCSSSQACSALQTHQNSLADCCFNAFALTANVIRVHWMLWYMQGSCEACRTFNITRKERDTVYIQCLNNMQGLNTFHTLGKCCFLFSHWFKAIQVNVPEVDSCSRVTRWQVIKMLWPHSWCPSLYTVYVLNVSWLN